VVGGVLGEDGRPDKPHPDENIRLAIMT